MRIAGVFAMVVALLLQGCTGVLDGIRMVMPLVMLVVVIGTLFYAIYGNRHARREENDRRKPDAEDGN